MLHDRAGSVGNWGAEPRAATATAPRVRKFILAGQNGCFQARIHVGGKARSYGATMGRSGRIVPAPASISTSAP